MTENLIPSYYNNFQVQILNKKVDLSQVTPKYGSKDSINHKPGKRLIFFMMTILYSVNICIFCSPNHWSIIGGGNAKIESQKSKSKSKTGSMDSVGQEPGADLAEVMKVRRVYYLQCFY